MQELIKIQTNENNEQLVSCRELYEKLGVNSNFTTWFKRMCEYGFEENKDFITWFPNLESEIHGGQNKIDYIIKLDMAKEICMIQRTEIGKQFRQYFIECERRLKEQSQFKLPTTYKEALLQLVEKVEENEKLLLENQEMKPKADFFEAVTNSKTAIQMSEVAKVLDMGIGRNKLFEILRDNKILMQNNRPYQKFIDNGWFRVIEVKYTKQNGDTAISLKTLVYQKGVNGIRKLLSK